MALPEPDDSVPYVKAMWRYARGVSAAKNGDIAAAQAEAAAIAALHKDADFTFLEGGGIPAHDVLAIAQHMIAGRIAQHQDDYEKAIEQFSAATVIEENLAYTEPPYWYYPVRQTLGAALLQAGRVDEAKQTFMTSLLRVPNNGWALFGLAAAYDTANDKVGAAQARALLGKAWVGDAGVLAVGNL